MREKELETKLLDAQLEESQMEALACERAGGTSSGIEGGVLLLDGSALTFDPIIHTGDPDHLAAPLCVSPEGHMTFKRKYDRLSFRDERSGSQSPCPQTNLHFPWSICLVRERESKKKRMGH